MQLDFGGEFGGQSGQNHDLAFQRALSSLEAARIRTGAVLDRRELHRAIQRFRLSPLDAGRLEERAQERGLLELTVSHENWAERTDDVDLVKILFAEMRGNGVLTSQQHREIARAMSTGKAAAEALKGAPVDLRVRLEKMSSEGREAFDRLIACNLRLVVSVARQYQKNGLDLLDLIQEGALGLMTAATRWDPEIGEFSTYATYWIRQGITRALADKSRCIRLPVHFHDELLAFRKVTRKLYERFGRQPSFAELAEHLGIGTERVAFLSEWERPVMSLDTIVGDDHTATLVDFVDHDTQSVADEVILRERRRLLEDLLSQLSPREGTILRLRFGFVNGKEQTLQEIGDRFGVTRERVRQLEAKALRKLRIAIGRSRYKELLAT